MSTESLEQQERESEKEYEKKELGTYFIRDFIEGHRNNPAAIAVLEKILAGIKPEAKIPTDESIELGIRINYIFSMPQLKQEEEIKRVIDYINSSIEF